MLMINCEIVGGLIFSKMFSGIPSFFAVSVSVHKSVGERLQINEV